MKRVFILLIIGMLTAPVVGQETEKKEEESTDYSEAIELVEIWLKAMQKYDELPGISAIALEDQEVIWEGAYGEANPEKGLPMEPNTICSVCSISKLFTSISIMNLYEEDKLRLDDEIQDVLPEYDLPQQYELSGPITIRNLLTHSSGLPRENAWSHWTEDDVPFPTKEQILDKLNEQETLYPSSTYFQYSNLAMALLGFVIEEVSGQSYDEYVVEHILNPLDLSDTRPEMPEELWGSQLAIGHAMEDLDGNQPAVPFFKGNGVAPAAGFSSTVQDLAKFAAWQFRLYEAEEEEILHPSTLKNMHNIHWMDSDFGTTWGLGFSVYKGSDGKKWVGHGGHCPGYKTSLALIPETKMAYSAFVNSSNANAGKYVRGIHGLLSKASSISKDDDANYVDELQEYVGVFRGNGMGWHSYYGTWGDKLVSIGLPSNNPADGLSTYRRVEKDHFVRIRDNGEDGESLRFIRNDEGEVVQLKSHENYISTKVDF
ncbi:MAG: beta-lactamase family protein [Balneolaceae bacterium]|nr:beta-lactamase family protein [Balneolaceae bacterium]MBO6545490.1 beta-lactamase family protein [Balneolaceae bacterium]MBO6646886.1 beta-lactamase family protein [Balneolaceae bacterium]